MARFSIIIPVYNVEKYIKRCIDSVLCQSYQDFEIIIVDDGSPDKSMEIINSDYSDNRITVISQENKGLGGARNTGVKHAKGDYIVFLDGDDYLTPDALDTIADRLNEKSYDAVVFDAYSVDESVSEKSDKTYIDCTLEFDGEIPKTDEYLPRIIQLPPMSWNKVVQTEFFKKNNFIFPEKMKYEDTLITRQILLGANSITAIKKPLYNYCKRSGSIMNSKPSKDIITMSVALTDYFSDKEFYDICRESLEAVAIRNIAYIFIEGNYKFENRYILENDEAIDTINTKYPEWRKNLFLFENEKEKIEKLLSINYIDYKQSYFTVSDMMYYAADGKHGTFGCIRMELDQEIDKDVMKKAFDRIIKRFPYFHGCLSFENGCLIERESNSVPVMHEDPLDYIIDYGDNDGLPYRFSVYDKYISIYMIHYLTDGSGLVRFLKVILNEYYKELGEDVLPDADAYDIEEEPDPEETFEPFDLVQNTKAPLLDLKKLLRYKLKEKRREDTYCYSFSVKRDKMMQFCSSYDGAPNAVCQYAFAKAIWELDKSARKHGVDVSVVMNAKPIFGIPKAHKPWLQLSGFHFDEKVFKKDISLLLTCIRGKTILDSSDLRLMSLFDEIVFLGNVIKHTKTLEAKQILSHYGYYLNQGAATVSYSGYTKFGSVEKHIKNIEIFAEYPTPLFEIAFANGCFYFTISANFKFDKYAEKIVSIFNDELGFECSDVRKLILKASPRSNKYTKLGINKGTLDAFLAFLRYLKHRNDQ